MINSHFQNILLEDEKLLFFGGGFLFAEHCPHVCDSVNWKQLQTTYYVSHHQLILNEIVFKKFEDLFAKEKFHKRCK